MHDESIRIAASRNGWQSELGHPAVQCTLDYGQ